jgi:hypothetical protein
MPLIHCLAIDCGRVAGNAMHCSPRFAFEIDRHDHVQKCASRYMKERNDGDPLESFRSRTLYCAAYTIKYDQTSGYSINLQTRSGFVACKSIRNFVVSGTPAFGVNLQSPILARLAEP